MKKMNAKTLFPYVLDHKPGFLLSWFLYRLFKRVRIDENMKESLKQMQKDGLIVYAVKYRGRLDYLLYHYNYRRRRLPYPKIAFDLNISMLLPFSRFVKIIFSQVSAFLRSGRRPSPYAAGFYKKAILEHTTSLLFLVDPKGFLARFIHEEKDPLEFLIETQPELDRPIFIVPQLILYQKSPEKDPSSFSSLVFGFQDHPGPIRKIILFFRYHREALIDFGRPLNLHSYLHDQPAGRSSAEMASAIRNLLIEDIDNQKRVILGPIVKSRQQIKEIVLMNPGVNTKIESLAESDFKKLKSLRKKADDYFEEIAADYNGAYVRIFHKILTWFWKKIYQDIDCNPTELARVRDWARRGPLIYIPSHKSHIDYLAINYVLYNYNMHIPRVAAGVNLTFWPMGHIFRKCGAFFIRRTFRDAALYAEVFNQYIKTLLQEGFPIEFYIEGGRSRNGKLILPKTGFLAILLQAYQQGFCKDLIFVPASIVYDRVLEEKSYQKEISGAGKERESLRNMIKARKFLNKKYGKVYIRFDEPFSFKEYLGPESAPQDARRALADHIARAINAVTLVTPRSLVALAILTVHRRGFLLSELTATVSTLIDFMARHRIPMQAALKNNEQMVRETISLMMAWKIVEIMEDTTGTEENFYFVDDERKIELEYYKNNIIHFFIPYSFTAVLLLSGHEEEKDPERLIRDYAFLQDLFKYEFIFEKDAAAAPKVLSALAYFREVGFLTAHNTLPRRDTVTKLGYTKLPIWAGLIKTFLESYWIAVKVLNREKEKTLTKEDLLKNMVYMGKRFYKLGVIDHIGALSRLNFQNALNWIQQDLFDENSGENDGWNRERLAGLAQKLYELSHYRL
ncbi:MAG: hypothetical protein EHM45_07580 [Desulfobacteraceae bacterium]|nr:MAG: hypothetical protein EHM45_07580 [Desulfobacteraceae bacterium]